MRVINRTISVAAPPACVFAKQLNSRKVDVVVKEETTEPEETLTLDKPVGANGHLG